jgi:hypothetical protein
MGLYLWVFRGICGLLVMFAMLGIDEAVRRSPDPACVISIRDRCASEASPFLPLSYRIAVFGATRHGFSPTDSADEAYLFAWSS